MLCQMITPAVLTKLTHSKAEANKNLNILAIHEVKSTRKLNSSTVCKHVHSLPELAEQCLHIRASRTTKAIYVIHSSIPILFASH
jgi:hypothetical protein